MLQQTETPGAATVFIVDHDDKTRLSLVNLFHLADVVSQSFRSGAELLGSADLDVPGCLLVDIQPGESSGFDLQERLADRACLLPIVFTTGEATVPIAVEAMKRGASDFLPKPLDDAAVLDAVFGAIRQNLVARARAAEREAVWRSIGTLTPREREVMKYVAIGDLNKQIAHRLEVSEMMVKIHRSRMMKKMGAGSLVQLIKKLELAYGRARCSDAPTATETRAP
ncbi:LuxR C-terminal-related transcriptional regulator [Rhizobium sp. BG4]|uniref:response regulator transcription factor n=1 Tax=Rhizobium sp. BG4 TaxID=2613770 RepID=UPI00193D30B4|nr:LuxR C-terminal-related transcriptional regulator [Rhizobium sp. BG4]QRM45794.1 response regulator transcription factor [Rhizobium sp. BG4]